MGAKVVVIFFAIMSSASAFFKCVDRNDSQVVAPSKECLMNVTFIRNATDRYSSYNIQAYAVNCIFNKVDLSVDYLDGANELSCDGGNESTRKSHSGYLIEDIAHCTETLLTLPVSYIFRGCYEISLTLIWQDGQHKNPQPPSFLRRWVDNEYSVDDFKLKPIFKTVNYVNSMDVEWIFRDIANSTYRDIGNLAYKVVLYENDTTHALNNSKMLSHRSAQKSLVVTQNCSVSGYILKCSIDPIPFGIFTVKLMLHDNPHCSSRSGIFHEYCGWTDTFERIWHVSKFVYKSDPNKSQHHTTVLILILIAIFVFVVLMVYLLMRLNSVLTKQQGETGAAVVYTAEGGGLVDIKRHPSESIFLVYARDCPAFMECMENFRAVLAKLTGCKVYDLFDEEQFNEIAKSPHEWVQRLIDDNTTKVVLMATEIGQILYQRLLSHFAKGIKDKPLDCGILLYKEPNFMDEYVLYTIKLISMNVNAPTPYQKYFVCRIPNPAKTEEYFSHINPFKRFDLPLAINFLIENLMSDSYRSFSDLTDTLIIEDINYRKQKFLNLLNNLKTYESQNPDYAKEIVSTDF